jgi:prevent-host-death family protein
MIICVPKNSAEAQPMALLPVEDRTTVTQFAQDPMAVLPQVQRTGRPVFVTAEGKADVVVMDAATYEKRLHTANLAKLLAAGEADVRAGRLLPAATIFAELQREQNI